VNWSVIQGNWKQLSGRLQERWGRLTRDDLRKLAGRRDRIMGHAQARYGAAWEKAEHQLGVLKDLLGRCKRATRH
jgi:uncharacterized protein YjbJ (UPF0337 family)